MITRIPVLDVRPQVEGGRYPVKAVEHEELTVRARIVGEGPVAVAAAVVLTGPDGKARPGVPMTPVGDDHWAAVVAPDAAGAWSFRIQSWHDPLLDWTRDAPARVEADVEAEAALAEGSVLLRRATDVDPAANAVADDLADTGRPAVERLAEALAFAGALPHGAVRDHLDTTHALPLLVDRERALVGAWYQMFPRSEGAVVDAEGRVQPGTLRTAAKRLEAVAAMGFDVVCLAPIHPIGRTGRRGADGRSDAGPDDPGSPWAVGSPEGGHDAVHPDLGTTEDLDAFVERAHQLGLEVALGLTLLCSPDHPWVAAHPAWFRRDAAGALVVDGDVVELDVDEDPVGVYLEVLRVVTHWVERGVTAFRVDDAHTKPPAFWQQLLTDLRGIDPDVVLQAGPGASPAMERALGTVGFHQTVTGFAHLEGLGETAAHLEETSGRLADVLRPAFFAGDPAAVPAVLRGGDEAAFRVRAALAATGSPTWGVCAGFELVENDAPGTAPTRSPEVHAVHVRDWEAPHSIAPFLTGLNEVRRAHPALRRLRNLAVHRTDHGGVLAYSRATGDDVVLVVADLYPSFPKTAGVRVTAAELGLPEGTELRLRDELDGSVHPVGAVPLDASTPVRVLTPVR